VISSLQEVFSLHGFGEIETRAVEPIGRLAGDSEASKEIYTLGRLTAEGDADAKLGLHFDLTVPFARYVEERQGQLHFPFRRYQVQKVWRGERPQEGRFREFYQADIDVVGRDSLPEHIDAEVAIVMARALAALPIPAVRMHMNNRELVEGFYEGVGITDVAGALRSVDKLDKFGPDGVRAELTAKGIDERAADAVLELAKITSPDATFVAAVEDLWETTALVDDAAVVDAAQIKLARGIASLAALVTSVNAATAGEGDAGVAVADLRIARGLDYYTGTVVETFLSGHEDLGSICSGGRYDSLIAGGGFPGVGMSIGVSRLVSRIISGELASSSRSVPSAVLVAVTDEEARYASAALADRLRARGIACEVSPNAAKFGKQIQYADRRGIPFVWFPGAGDGASADGEVKDIRSGEQVAADADAWVPPVEDLSPRIVHG
jgi:histidyl-tRNA synthetase